MWAHAEATFRSNLGRRLSELSSPFSQTLRIKAMQIHPPPMQTFNRVTIISKQLPLLPSTHGGWLPPGSDFKATCEARQAKAAQQLLVSVGGMLCCFRGYTGIIEMTWKLLHCYRGYIMEKKIETTTFWFAAYRGNGTLASLNTCCAILGSQPIE